jgi:hypothetical protein
MSKAKNLTVLLDLSQALEFGILYHPVIGRSSLERNPFVVRLRPKNRMKFREKFLASDRGV